MPPLPIKTGRISLFRGGIVLAGLLLAGAPLAVLAQYPGRIETKKAARTDRAIAVLEWTGQPGKPSASRIIPISVYDGEQYQPGGLYLAQPEPLALESGTEYILQLAGQPKGLFDVNTAQDVQGYWFGYGDWKPLMEIAPVHKLQPAKILPQVVGDRDRPHLKDSSPKPSSQQSPPPASPPPDPDRPTLRRRQAPASQEPAEDITAPDTTPRETAIGGADPDRPHLTHQQQSPTDSGFEPTKLSGVPPGLQQMIAVSDATNRDPHPFAFTWGAPGDADKMRVQLEGLAQKAIAATEPPSAPAPKPRTVRTAQHTHRSTTSHSTKTVHLPVLSQERFSAYELSYSGGATLVFSAQATDAAGKVKYVTLIAQPDLYGVPVVLLKSVTDDDDLDVTPRMRFVDAVDTTATDHGDLIFELRSRHDRQFAIYTISGGKAQQVFSTGPLPISQS